MSVVPKETRAPSRKGCPVTQAVTSPVASVADATTCVTVAVVTRVMVPQPGPWERGPQTLLRDVGRVGNTEGAYG